MTEPMKFLSNYLYEYHKGIRPLFMLTMPLSEVASVRRRLEEDGIDVHVDAVNTIKANLFFGRPVCVAIVRAIVTRPLNELTPEEDFILGTMLGYDKEQQCCRLLRRIDTGSCVQDSRLRCSDCR